MSNLLRTKEGANAYEDYKNAGCLDNDGCVLCKAETLEDFTLWRIIPNKFPYDLISIKHTMLVPKRHANADELTDEEKAEHEFIKRSKLELYDYFIEVNEHLKSIPAHYHLHLIVGKVQPS